MSEKPLHGADDQTDVDARLRSALRDDLPPAVARRLERTTAAEIARRRRGPALLRLLGVLDPVVPSPLLTRLAVPAALVLLASGTLLQGTPPPAASLVAVGGAALLLLRVARRAAARDALAPALALSGLLAGLAGLVLSLAGYAARDLGRVTAGLSFLLSSGFAALLGLLLVARAVGGPREGRSAVAGTVAWALLPLAALLFLVCAVAAALTPMTAPG